MNEPLSPERIFASSKSFLFKFVISRFLYCKKFHCDEKKNVSVCDRRKPNSCNPKNYFDRDFSARALCIMVIIKLHPLFIYIMYMYVQKRYFPLWLNQYNSFVWSFSGFFFSNLKWYLSLIWHCVFKKEHRNDNKKQQRITL